MVRQATQDAKLLDAVVRSLEFAFPAFNASSGLCIALSWLVEGGIEHCLYFPMQPACYLATAHLVSRSW